MSHRPTATPGSDITAWWASAVVYQIYPRSFADANGDGMGDLLGVTARLPYLQRLGVDAIWLSPFYKSPQADAGYDVADYRQVDPMFGRLADFDGMLQKAHSLGLKVIVDLVPNHTSDEHAWFQQALAAAPGSAERDRYMFRPGKDQVAGSGDGNLAPNNWKSIFGGPAWTRTTNPDGSSGDWYLHLFDTKQPDLNWENPEVREEMRSVLRFWLDRGVDGFRVDVAHGMVKEEGLPDWDGVAAMVEGTAHAGHLPDAPGAHTEAVEPHTAHHHYDRAGSDHSGDNHSGDDSGHQPVSPLYPPSPFFDQDGVHEIYRDWNRVLAGYDGDRMLVAEAWVEPAERLARYIRKDEMQQAFNFDFLLAGWDAQRMAVAIEDSLEAAASVGAPSTWVLSNHDTVRHTSRFGLADPTTFPKGIAAEDDQPDAALGLARARAATLVSFALPGSAYMYQGEELGLPEHTTLPAKARQDPTFFRTNGIERGRDGCRVPLPWKSGEPGYGFADAYTDAVSSHGVSSHLAPAPPWLPQPESFGELAADRQDGVEGSTLELYRSALSLRKSHGLGSGSFCWADMHDPELGVLAFQNRDVLVIANMGAEPIPVPDGYRVELSSASGGGAAGPAFAQPAVAEPAVVGAAAGRTGRRAAAASGALAGGTLAEGAPKEGVGGALGGVRSDAAVIAPNTAAYLVAG